MCAAGRWRDEAGRRERARADHAAGDLDHAVGCNGAQDAGDRPRGHKPPGRGRPSPQKRSDMRHDGTRACPGTVSWTPPPLSRGHRHAGLLPWRSPCGSRRPGPEAGYVLHRDVQAQPVEPQWVTEHSAPVGADLGDQVRADQHRVQDIARATGRSELHARLGPAPVFGEVALGLAFDHGLVGRGEDRRPLAALLKAR